MVRGARCAMPWRSRAMIARGSHRDGWLHGAHRPRRPPPGGTSNGRPRRGPSILLWCLSSPAETFRIQEIVMHRPPRCREWSVLRPFLIVIPLAMALALTALASTVAAEETRPEPELHTASGDPDHPRPWQRANTDWMYTARWGVLCQGQRAPLRALHKIGKLAPGFCMA